MRQAPFLFALVSAAAAGAAFAQTTPGPASPTPGVSPNAGASQDATVGAPTTQAQGQPTPPATARNNDVRQTRRVPPAPPGAPASPASPPSVAPPPPPAETSTQGDSSPVGPSGASGAGGSTSNVQPPAPGVRPNAPGCD